MGSETELFAGVQREDAGDQKRATEAAGAIRESGYLKYHHVCFRIHLAKTTSSFLDRFRQFSTAQGIQH